MGWHSPWVGEPTSGPRCACGGPLSRPRSEGAVCARGWLCRGPCCATSDSPPQFGGRRTGWPGSALLSHAVPADPRSPAGVSTFPFTVHPVFWPCGGRSDSAHEVPGPPPGSVLCGPQGGDAPPLWGCAHAASRGLRFWGSGGGCGLGRHGHAFLVLTPGWPGLFHSAWQGRSGAWRADSRGVACVPGAPGRGGSLGRLPGGAGAGTLRNGAPASQASAREALSAGLGPGRSCVSDQRRRFLAVRLPQRRGRACHCRR